MGTHPIFESDFDCLTEKFHFSHMANDYSDDSDYERKKKKKSKKVKKEKKKQNLTDEEMDYDEEIKEEPDSGSDWEKQKKNAAPKSSPRRPLPRAISENRKMEVQK